jgi:hypothetical protein
MAQNKKGPIVVVLKSCVFLKVIEYVYLQSRVGVAFITRAKEKSRNCIAKPSLKYITNKHFIAVFLYEWAAAPLSY